MKWLAYIIPFIWLYILKPLFSTIVGFLDWCARNIWFLFSVVLCWFIYIERRGLYSDIVPETTRLIFMRPLMFGITLFEIFIVLTFFTIFVYFYRMIRKILYDLFQTLKRWVAAIVLVSLYIYYKLVKKEDKEFLVIEGMVSIKDILIVFFVLFAIVSVIVFALFMQQQMENDITITFAKDMLDFGDVNVTVVDGQIVVNGSEVVDIADKPIKSYGVVVFNMTTSEYGKREINVTRLVDLCVNYTDTIGMMVMRL